MTKDGGDNWTKLNSKLPGMPKFAFIPQIEMSKTNPNEVFVVINNYRNNDWTAFLYHSTDNGVTWRRIVDNNDVDGFVCSVVQDPKNENLIFLGTDVGLYVSFDHGQKWVKWAKGLPPVQIRDMKIQSDFDDLVLGTFGRSFWVLDDIESLRELANSKMETLNSDFTVFAPGTAFQTSRRSYDGIRFNAQGEFVGDNRRGGAVFTIWKKPSEEEKNRKDDDGIEDKKSEKKKKGKKKGKKGKKKEKQEDKQDKKDEKPENEKDKSDDEKSKLKKDEVQIMAINFQGDTVRTFKRKLKDGMNRIGWNPDTKGVDFPTKRERKEKPEPGGMPIIPGNYKMVFVHGDYKDSTNLKVALDPRIEQSYFNPQAKYDAMKSYNGKIEKITEAFDNLKSAKKSMKLYKQIIDVQPDTVKKEYSKMHKSIESQVDSLMNLYMLPEAKKVEYRDSSETLMSKIRSGRRFLGTSAGAPTPNGQNAVNTALKASNKVIESVNGFFSGEWSEYVEKVKTLPVDIFKEYKEIEIE